MTATPAVLESLAKWDAAFPRSLAWKPLKPSSGKSDGDVTLSVADDGTVRADKAAAKATYSVEIPLAAGKLNAVRLETLPDETLPGKGAGFGGGNFVLSKFSATITPPNGTRLNGRFVRVELPGKARFLHLAEVQVFAGNDNLAPKGEAKQSTTDFGGDAKRANDGNTDGNYLKNSVSHTAQEENPWWEVDLKSEQSIDRVVLWNRTDATTEERMRNFRVLVLNDKHESVWSKDYVDPPKPSSEFALSGVRGVSFAAAFADHDQGGGYEAKVVLAPKPNLGWAVGGKIDQPHALTLITSAPVEVADGSTLTITLEQTSSSENHTLGKFRLSLTDDPRAAESAKTPASILTILNTPAEQRNEAQRAELTKFHLTIAPELAAARDQLAATNIQLRGNFMDLGKEVTPGVPAAFHPLPEGSPPDRLALAKWLVDERNPLTARVLVNRYWDTIFGNGLVRTSEEFGSQGDLPTHPELLDWLATEVVRLKWDTKALLKLIVTSATYRQSAKVTSELLDRDPENYLLARGPRFRLSAEMIRDQALAVSGLLSPKMFGPPVKPFQPNLGVSAAFGSGIDWQASAGEDKYRRGLYTTWRRSNPYPSMSAFDAPNREVCTIRRARTNTPLQALVTLNDPVYIEAAQALARTMTKSGTSPADHIRAGFQQCVSRPPTEKELADLTKLFNNARERFAKDVEKARKLATSPLGPLPEGADPVELAALTVVGNVLLNLDEMLMRR
ncbi:MAG: F5/8 type C domain-containing protein [Planctomycetota bacterium]|nr:MAG: F5/8 type C domain-containing protein [Planctomycetota bacterium]